jgi:hypothetical protein
VTEAEFVRFEPVGNFIEELAFFFKKSGSPDEIAFAERGAESVDGDDTLIRKFVFEHVDGHHGRLISAA